MTATKPKTTETIKEAAPTYHYGTGRRKAAIAQVRVMKGSGKYIVNDADIVTDPYIARVITLVGLTDKVDISAHVHGGGAQGQIIAIRHGLARALVEFDAALRATLKKAGLLTRDSREKERKKYGLHSARRAPQFAKR